MKADKSCLVRQHLVAARIWRAVTGHRLPMLCFCCRYKCSRRTANRQKPAALQQGGVEDYALLKQ